MIVPYAASLPDLDKQGSLVAIRDVGGETERNQYGIVGIEGDSIAFERAIARYLAMQCKAEDLPLSSVIYPEPISLILPAVKCTRAALSSCQVAIG